MKKSIIIFFAMFLMWTHVDAQYFGRNKPRYEKFDFQVINTEHFNIHHECQNHAFIEDIADKSEVWYHLHQEVLKDTFNFRNPMIFYNTHPEFQQTNAISSTISSGTGGVTEAFKNRVVLPFAFTNQQTNHVLGHELVHAFQYHIILQGDSTNLNSLSNLPLWMVEGLAEYMSKSRVDPFTAMWMRDAVLQDDVPSLKDLSSGKYFPYRYGQAFWAYVAGKFGDQIIRPLFENTAKLGLKNSVPFTLGISLEELSEDWQKTIKEYYDAYLFDRKERLAGSPIASKENSGNLNISPSISPNGRYMIFSSEKDVFTIEMFLMDLNSGEIIEKLTSRTKDGHLDEIGYIESSGTWSPDSERFAYVAVSKGRNVIVIKDVSSGKTLQTLKPDGIYAIANPTWSPKNNQIIFSGMVDGQTDLYGINLDSGEISQYTDDLYSEIMPTISNDGNQLVFATDELSFQRGRKFGKYTFDIAVMSLENNQYQIYDQFHGADNLNPQFDYEGNVLFLSDRDGYRNLYKYDVTDNQIYQMTEILTGISGITSYSPAISVSQVNDEIVYTHFADGKYSLYKGTSSDFLKKPLESYDLNFEPGTLPKVYDRNHSIVERNFEYLDDIEEHVDTEIENVKYEPRFKLDYISGGGGVGVSTSNTFNNYSQLQGAIQAIFGDVLGNHQMFATVAMNGEIVDAGGQFTYINRKNRLAWGASVSHIPTRTGYIDYPDQVDSLFIDDNTFIPTLKYSTNIVRIFEQDVSGFIHFPISSTLRLEGGFGATMRSFRQDRYDDYYEYFGNGFTGNLIKQERERLEIGDEINFSDLYILNKGGGLYFNAAFVGDNSYFGLTAPLDGHRFRLSFDRFYGADDYVGVLADFRKYYWMKPFSFAVRGLSYIKQEYKDKTAYPFYLAQMGFVHGYGSIINAGALEELPVTRGQLYGTKMALLNFEIRMPFTGPEQLALIKSKFLLTDLNVFFDIGTVFDNFSDFDQGRLRNQIQYDESGQTLVNGMTGEVEYALEEVKPLIARSVGVSARINLLGAMIIEPYYAWPLVDGIKPNFGVNLIPGW